MKKTFVWVLAVVVVCSIVAVAADNSDNAGNVPKLIRLSKFEVKVGKMDEFAGISRQVRQALNSGDADYHFVAATPIAGTGGVVDFLAFYDDYGQIEKSMK